MDVHNAPGSKKRKKHVPVFDSSEQKHVFDYYLDLPKHEPGLETQWHAMFDFPCYNPQRPQVFKDLVSKCIEEIAALENAYEKAERFIQKVNECLRKKHHRRKYRRYASMVTETISTRHALVLRRICDAKNMIVFVKKDVDTYVRSVDNIALNCYHAMCQCNEKVKQLAEIDDVCKLIKYFTECKDINDEQIKDCCGLTPVDMSLLILALHSENKFCIDVEENFGQSEMEHVLEEHKKSIGEVHVLWVAYEEADAKLKEQMLNYISFFSRDVDSLLRCLRSARDGLTITHKQLKLLYEKNVIVTGFYETFYGDWKVASIPDRKVASTIDPVDAYSTPEPVGHSLQRSLGVIYDGSQYDD